MMLAVIFFLFLFGCESIRDVNVCKLDPEKKVGHCAKGDKKFEMPMSEMTDWYAIPKTDMQKLAEKLQNCEQSKTD